LSSMQKGALDWKGYGESEFKDGVYHFSDEGTKAKQVDAQRGRVTDLEKRLEGLKTGDCPIPILTIASKGLLELGHFPIIEEGKAGILSYPEFACKAPFGTNSDSKQINARVFQVIDESQMLMELQGAPVGNISIDAEFKQTFLVKMSTAGRVDDESITLKGVFVVSGRHQYKTVGGGSKTVFVLERIDPEWLKVEAKKRMPPSTINRVVEFVEEEKAQRAKEEVNRKAEEDRVTTERARTEAAAARAEEARLAAEEKREAEKEAAKEKRKADKKAADEKAEANRKAAIEEAKWRTWTDSTGQFKTKAMFGGMAGGKVKLIKKDGSTLRVPLEKLSDEDQRWIESKSH